ncbi:MAG: Anti-sigma factor NepR [Pseudomonadota bacterium]|jgi:hypothetical protein
MNHPRKQQRLAERDEPPAIKPRPSRAAPRPDPISAGLRALWASLEEEPVPDDFLALLDRMDEADAPRPAGGPTP